ncbi:dihydroxy-acid dehydratase [Mesorhizobium sp. M4B.F.Ca.ET.190.01.1.1]|uniref:L-arabinonate dehydratase n=1 Tax=unclassified Mesorhizobium TaxID=325217 RepID=UPI0010928968|nr:MULTISPECIES: L-arabinonate dehydratase [unclassified Mesorhizobium]TGR10510.1 dihydroxy-acid dehydratase [Mesorhizobium sp. M4B.F.Ca.ET.200.01.1.1]TGS19600.1 dihydroxy-acid dehydratase [Mesorhizobium sp. M4B.F.Ca.ET.190.01.1.1]TGT32433.1 dihydroxy-acid dehydratase [Mesorhizobium sp. M4B.F.Ca.ET.172.01.1.1]
MAARDPSNLRSARWFGPDDMRTLSHRARMKQMGYASDDFDGKPVIAILNTWSDLNPCHAHFKTRVDDVKRGIVQAGGFPVELPAMALGEVFMKPSTMLYRNLLSMQAEEQLRANPVDGVVLMGGCDKTVPGLLMGAFSMNLPAIFVPAGPMLSGNWRGERLGSGSDIWKFWADRRAGSADKSMQEGIESGIARSPGTCMTMGTASTMAAITETLGMTLPGAATIPAVDAAHARMASASGRRIVDMVWEDLKPSDILSPASFDNAIKIALAMGGSTNAVIHLVALAGRAGIKLDPERFDEFSAETPFIVNVRPSGKYLMEDFHFAGGVGAALKVIADRLDLTTRTVGGISLGEAIAPFEVYLPDVIRPLGNPVEPAGALVVLKGSLAPDGAVIKRTAAEPRLLKHRGPALVFKDYNDMTARIDDPGLNVDENSVLVLQNSGPNGGPGMPEWGQLPIPKKLLEKGIRDMIRISDARMSGTSYGACVLHVAPESFVGGPIGLLRDGDIIEMDVDGRRIDVLISAQEIEARRKAWVAPVRKYERGYGVMYSRHVTQANLGCDFDFLTGNAATAEPEIH